MKINRKVKIGIGVFAVLILLYQIPQPSNDRNWSKDQELLPITDIQDHVVNISNIRNFNYRDVDDYDIDYYDKSFDLNKIESLWYVVEPFSKWKGAAHTFLSFGFEGDEYISISVEIRKEEGEEFSSWKGLLKQYEIMYVVGDERDLIKLRSNHRKDIVYLYPAKTSKENIRQLFVDMLESANDLQDSPQFYNTITNTCTSVIADHINKIAEDRIPFSYKILLAAHSDKLALDLGLLDTDLSLEEARQKFRMNERAEFYGSDPNFSVRIRQFDF